MERHRNDMNFDESQKMLLWAAPSSIVYDKKLDTALRSTSVRMIKQLLSDGDATSYNLDINLLLQHYNESDLLYTLTDNSCYARILNHLFRMTRNRQNLYPNASKNLVRAYNMAMDNMHFQHHYSMQSNELHTKRLANRSLHELSRKMMPTLLIRNLMGLSDQFRSIIDRTPHLKRALDKNLTPEDKVKLLAKENKCVIACLDITIVWGWSHFIIETPDSKIFFMPMSYMLLIHNKLSDLISVLVLIQYQSGICHSVNAYETVVRMIQEMTTLSIRYRDDFARIAGCIEGMVIGEILLEAEEWRNTDLLDNIQSDLMEKIGYDYKSSQLRKILLEADIPLRNELGCLSKMLGHPFVDMQAGALKLHKRTTTPKLLTYASISWVTNKAKESFVKQYVSRHHKWPPVEISFANLNRDPLLQANLRNKDPDHPSITEVYGTVKNEDWARVELQPCLEFQQLDNVIPFLKDKSISVLRHEAVQLYLDRDSEKKGRWADTRLLLYYLLNPLKKLDHQEFVRRYTDAATLEELADYLIIRLVPKEKEHKIEFRGFGVKTYLDRMRNLTQEKNVAKFLDLYCDEQSMTLSELEISQRLYSLRTILKAYKGWKVLYINFDSSGWNNCFRDESVKPVIRETLSRIMGHDVMHRIHEGYEKSLFIIPDGDVTFHWEGQQGGIDGLNQYAWVWVYVNQIKYAMKDLPFKFHMLCKGDDMRLAVMIHPSMIDDTRDMKYYHSIIVNKVEEAAKEFGHEINIKESYGSEKFFTHSKVASLGTIELPQGFRKIQKVYGANNAMIAVLDEYIASSFSNAHSACKCMSNTYSAYFVACVWSYWQIIISGHYNNLSDDQLLALLLIPNMLGGFPVIYLHNMRVRAESDLLSPFIEMVKFAARTNPRLHRVLCYALKCKIMPGDNLTRLYRDPYSLNIRTPQLPVSKLRSFILPSLSRRIQNKDVKDLIKAAKSVENKTIIKCMETAVPQNAKIMSTIYGATPEGVLSELLRKFESGRSVLDLLITRGRKSWAERKLRQVLQVEYDLQTWRWRVITNKHDPGCVPLIPDNMWHLCSTELAQYCRDSTWNCRIDGISMPAMAHQITLVNPMDAGNNEHILNNHFTYIYDPPNELISPNASPHWGVSGKHPFLGFTTRTGNIAPQVNFQDKDPLLIKVKNLLDLLSWVNVAKTSDDGTETISNLGELIKYIIAMYSSVSVDELAPFTAVRKSGTIQHHARAPRFRESIVPNVLSNIYQNVVGCSDSHVTLTSSTQKYTMNFLHIMCECLHLLHIELETSDTISTPRMTWGVTTDCEYCNRPITEDPIMIQVWKLPSIIPPLLGACRIDDIAKNLIIKSYNDFNEQAFKLPANQGDPEDDLAAAAVVAEFVNSSFHSRTNLQNRFTHHAMSADAKRVFSNMTHKTGERIIGLTELKSIPLMVIVNSLALPIYEYIITRYGIKDPDLILVDLMIAHSYELPWYELLALLAQIRRLGPLVLLIQKLSGIRGPPCFEDHSMSTPHIGYVIYKLVHDQRIELRLAIRSNLEMNIAVAEYRYISQPLRMKLMQQMFITLARQWKPLGPDDGTRSDLCLRAIYVALLHVDHEAIHRYLCENGDGNRFLMLRLDQFVAIDHVDLDMMIMDDMDDDMRMLRWVRDKYPSWPWDDAIARLSEDMDDRCLGLARQISNTLTQVRCYIGVCDIQAAISVVRRNSVNRNVPEELQEYEQTNEEDSDLEEVWDHDALREIVCRGPKKPLNPCILEFTCSTGEQVTPRELAIIEIDYNYDRIMFDPSYYLKIYGSTTTSQSKLDFIMSLVGMDRSLPTHSIYLCAADGYGGFAEYIASQTQDSTIVFNTLLVNIGKNTYPFAAYKVCKENRIEVDNSLLNVGIDDLTTNQCVESLKNYGSMYTGITCDADIRWDDHESAIAIQWNIVDIFLTNAAPQAFLVTKMNLNAANLVANILSYLRMFCRRVLLIKCPNSNIGGEVYLFAQDPQRAPLHVNKNHECNDDECRAFNRYSTRMRREYEEALKSQVVTIVPPVIHGMRTMHGRLEPSANVKLYTRLNLEVNLEAIVNECQYVQEAYVKVIQQLKNHDKLLRDNLTNPLKNVPKNVAIKVVTMTYSRLASMKVIMSQGAIWFLTMILDSKFVNRTTLRNKYNDVLASLPRKLGFYPPKSCWYKKGYHMDGSKDLRPYARFMDGIRLAQMVSGYIVHSRKRYAPVNELHDLLRIFDDGA
ncbi:RNA-dependent RNA polymerase [Wenling chuvirus-like virus 2]|uniref:RNA-dependent RNA polymerase n=1 Tax=Wenling chuvirus-like virus 2 TaxID=1922378 RepID=UPI00090AAD94|nr:RNA-dependent RNA polymerase [Wenling chuvirus-like virus 2]APG78831.1 RNA-dependent RNA polymerase [Wenling chuvirus-like virus 2]